MANIYFLYNNLISSATLTASSAATGFPASNLQNPFRTKVWRTAGATAGTANLVINLSATTRTMSASNLVANGADWTGGPPPTGWTAENCTLAAAAGGVAGNCLQMTRTGGDYQQAYCTITTEVGKMYRVYFYVKSGTAGNVACQSMAYSGDGTTLLGAGSGTSSGSWVQVNYYFTAIATTSRIYVAKTTADAGTILFDSLEVYGLTGGEMTCVALAGYNWASAPGTLNLEFNSLDSWGAPPQTEALTWAANPTTNGNNGVIIKTFTSRAYQYVRLNVVHSPGGTPTDWDLGVLFLGSYFQPTRNYSIQYGLDIVDESMRSRSIGGQDHFDEIGKYRTVDMSFMVGTQAQWELFQTMFNTVGVSRDLFAAFDYTSEPDEMTIYGKFTQLPSMQYNGNNISKLDLSFAESR